MPSRFICLAILIYWLIAAFFLLTRDVLPELTLGYPPDLRTIAAAGKHDRAVKWSIQVIDDPKNSEARRTVGEAVTNSVIREDEQYELKSRASLDSDGLFKRTPFATIAVGRLDIESRYLVDSKGNLVLLELEVTSREAPDFLLTVEGRVKDQDLEITFRGKGIEGKKIEQTRSFPYEPRSMVGNVFGPLDRLPGLHVGQRWETRMVNPLSGQVDRVRVEVVKRTLIDWSREPVSVFEVLQTFSPLTSARSWVRTDGVILRQEIPLPLVNLVLERQRQADEASKTEVTAP